jgi:hypothetical protein
MLNDNETFELLVFLNWTQREADDAQIRQQEAFISDAVDSLVSYVESVGNARIDGGWNWS